MRPLDLPEKLFESEDEPLHLDLELKALETAPVGTVVSFPGQGSRVVNVFYRKIMKKISKIDGKPQKSSCFPFKMVEKVMKSHEIRCGAPGRASL